VKAADRRPLEEALERRFANDFERLLTIPTTNVAHRALGSVKPALLESRHHNRLLTQQPSERNLRRSQAEWPSHEINGPLRSIEL
jgi:hypothetical protein